MKHILLLAGIVCALALSGCYTVPETGRTAVILPLFDDVQQGAQAFSELKASEKISTDPADNAQVQRVGQRIATAVGNRMPGAQWEFVVFDAPKTVNAFALPGGKVGVYTGLLRLAGNDDELAFVIGHEIAHVTSRHGAQRVTAQVGVAVGAAVLAESTKDKKNSELYQLAYGLGSTGGTLAYSRFHESEADFIGLRYSAYAGYDPRAAISFWKKMSAGKADSGWLMTLLSTHPADAQRIAAMEKELPNVLPIYEANRRKE
ncbi:MAG: M48 family metallopeptidase [Opitutaceae bacterium]|nr:M48 family metallopeptidase [Opitutaceae bacterium]MBP7373417.1 M48 family metallopeptidase [Opitutaceae bacterium]